MEEPATTKSTWKGFFQKAYEFFVPFSKTNKKHEPLSQSRFKLFLKEIKKRDPIYEKAEEAVMLCDASLRIVYRRLSLVNKLKKICEEMDEISCFEALTSAETENLKNLLERFSGLAKDKNVLKYQVTSFDKSVTYMKDLQDEAPKAISEIREAEAKQRIFKQDIGVLQGEKSELEYEREQIIRGLHLMHQFSIGMVVVFGFVCIFLAFLAAQNKVNVFFPFSVLFILVAISVVLLYTLRKKMTFALQVNHKKQMRAVEMLNQKSVVCAHYTNFLQYEYRKFKVRNADMLKNNLKEYNHYKHVSKRFDAIRSIMYQTEEEIDRFLRSKNMNNMTKTLEQFAKTIDIDDKKQYYKELATQRKTIEENLETIDKQQEQIWETLIALNEQNKDQTTIIDAILQAYMEEAGNAFSHATKFNPDDLDSLDKEAVGV